MNSNTNLGYRQFNIAWYNNIIAYMCACKGFQDGELEIDPLYVPRGRSQNDITFTCSVIVTQGGVK